MLMPGNSAKMTIASMTASVALTLLKQDSATSFNDCIMHASTPVSTSQTVTTPCQQRWGV